MYQITFLSKINNPSILFEAKTISSNLGFVSKGGFFYKVIGNDNNLIKSRLSQILYPKSKISLSELIPGKSFFTERWFGRETCNFSKEDLTHQPCHYLNFGIYSMICVDCMK